MMGAGEFHDGLSTTDPPGLQHYRSVSGWSVLTLLLGLLSFIALAHPAAWSIPALAVVCGAWALRQLRRQVDVLMGAPLAVTGMGLGFFFLSWALTSYFGDHWLINRASRQFGEQWLAAVLDGQLSKAYQATLPVRERQPEGTELDEYYENNPLRRAERDAYFNDGIPKQLAQLAEGGGRFVFDRNLGMTIYPTYMLTSPRFYIYREGEDQPWLHLQMEAMRESDADGDYWVLFRMADAEAIDHQLHAHRQRRQPAVAPHSAP